MGIPPAVGEAACGGARGGGVGGIHDVVEVALAKAAGHHPLPVAFSSETVKRFAFLGGARHPKVGQSIAFGVFRNRYENCNAPDLNFHDLTPCMGLPRTSAIPGSIWSECADLLFRLEPLLPSRKEAVETPFPAELHETAQYVIYIYRAAAAPDPVPCAATGSAPTPPGSPRIGIAAADHARYRMPRLSAILQAAAPDPPSTDEPESDA